MSVDLMDRTAAEELVARWRTSIDVDHPAGPLYTGGEHAEADIITAAWTETTQTCSSCTASRTVQCC
jgi:hypothetical protein